MAGNGRTHVLTVTGLLSDVTYCFTGSAALGSLNISSPTFWDRVWVGPSTNYSGWSSQVCGDMSQAGQVRRRYPAASRASKSRTPLFESTTTPITAPGASISRCSALFDTRPLSTNPGPTRTSIAASNSCKTATRRSSPTTPAPPIPGDSQIPSPARPWAIRSCSTPSTAFRAAS